MSSIELSVFGSGRRLAIIFPKSTAVRNGWSPASRLARTRHRPRKRAIQYAVIYQTKWEAVFTGCPAFAEHDESEYHTAAGARACWRILVNVVVGVIASGSIFRCTMAGLPDCSAARNAASKSAVFSTVTPKPPNARA